jgi:5-methylcytosine-specific restriction endonuclease McrA
MRYRSAKKEAGYRLRRPLVKRMLERYPHCQACGVFAKYDGKVTYVQNPSVDIHELVRRSQGGSILEESNLLAVCRQCHDRIGRYPQLAFDLGLSKHHWDK